MLMKTTQIFTEDFNCDIVTSSGSHLKCRNLRRFTLHAILDASTTLPTLPLQATLGLESSVSSAASIYQCLFDCGRSFSTLSWMQRHMRLECSKKQEPACNLCNASYANANCSKKHMTDYHEKL